MEPTKDVKPAPKPEVKMEAKKPGKFEVLVRHSPFPKKKLTVTAASKDEAWQKFCEANVQHAEKLLRLREAGGDSKKYKKIWVADVKNAAQADRSTMNVTIKELV